MKNTDHEIFVYLLSFGKRIAKTNIAIIKASHISKENQGVLSGKKARIDILPKAAHFTGTVPLNPAQTIPK